MPLFRRRKDDADAADHEVIGELGDLADTADTGDRDDIDELGTDDTGDADERVVGSQPGRGDSGPWDASTAPDDGAVRADLGGLLVPGFPGMELRLEVDRGSDRVVGASAVALDGQLQIQAFAAPRTAGLWDEVRQEIVDGIVGAGGSVEEVDGPFGRELVGMVPSEGGAGPLQPARFVGVDGPRWFLRGVFSQAAARPGPATDALERVLAGTVVVRGDAAMAPRDLIPLTVPDQVPALPDEPGRPTLDALKRGPEITEIR